MIRCYAALFVAFLLAVPSLSQDLRLAQDAPAPRSVGTAFAPDPRAAQPAFTPSQPWQVLQRISPDTRLHATLTVATDPSASPEARALAGQAAASWNAGDGTAAVKALYDLGTMVGPENVELCLSWHDTEPVSRQRMLAGNVRVGTLDTIAGVALAANVAASRLYAMVSHDTLGGSMHLYRSTDKGLSWTLTQTISGIGDAPQMALSPLSSSLYVGYIPSSAGRVLRVRKFKMDTGVVDSLVNGVYFMNAMSMPTADTLREVAGTSNITVDDHRMYFILRTHTKQLHFLWSIPTRDSLWSEATDSSAAGVTRGLSIAYAKGLSGYGIYLAYVDSAERVCIDTINTGGTFFKRSLSFYAGANTTSISAYGDTAVCAFENRTTGSVYVRYLISYNAGGVWATGTPIDTNATTETPSVMLEKGQGIAIYYRHYGSGSSREGRVIRRTYAYSSVWAGPTTITDYVPHYWKAAIAALGSNTWGVAYLSYYDLPVHRAALFAQYQYTATDVAEDQPATPLAFGLSQNYPNPFNPSTSVRYVVPKAGQVNLTVYDVLGRQVAQLVNGMEQAGQHVAVWNAAGVASGVYYYRLQAGEHSATLKMVLMK
jgi:hypothetical protein